jgi:hypothetical protein
LINALPYKKNPDWMKIGLTQSGFLISKASACLLLPDYQFTSSQNLSIVQDLIEIHTLGLTAQVNPVFTRIEHRRIDLLTQCIHDYYIGGLNIGLDPEYAVARVRVYNNIMIVNSIEYACCKRLGFK